LPGRPGAMACSKVRAHFTLLLPHGGHLSLHCTEWAWERVDGQCETVLLPKMFHPGAVTSYLDSVALQELQNVQNVVQIECIRGTRAENFYSTILQMSSLTA
jgi:hypothetical protein